MVSFDQATNHWPVFVPLCFFGFDQVFYGEQFINNSGAGIANRCPALPKFLKFVTASHFCHYIQSNTFCVWMLASEVDRMSAGKVLGLEFRNCDALSLQFLQGTNEAIHVRFVGQDNDITIAAKLRCAVKHARLPAHKQVLYRVA